MDVAEPPARPPVLRVSYEEVRSEIGKTLTGQFDQPGTSIQPAGDEPEAALASPAQQRLQQKTVRSPWRAREFGVCGWCEDFHGPPVRLAAGAACGRPSCRPRTCRAGEPGGAGFYGFRGFEFCWDASTLSPCDYRTKSRAARLRNPHPVATRCCGRRASPHMMWRALGTRCMVSGEDANARRSSQKQKLEFSKLWGRFRGM